MTKEIITGLILALAIVGYLEWRNEPVETAIRNEVRSVYLRQCDATVSDGEHYASMSSPKCYFFRDHK